MKKKIVLLISMSAILLFASSCETLKESAKEITRSYIEEHKPDIKVKSAKISSITLQDITLTTLFEIKNNLDFEVPIEKVQIDLINTSGKTFATASSVETLKIPANQARDINLDFKAKYVDVFTTAFDAIKTKTFKCDAKITLTFTVYGMKFAIPYTKELTFKE